MFTSVVKIVLQKRNLLSSSQSLIRFISTDSESHNNSFTISNLISTYGLSQEKAKKVEKLHFQSPTNVDSVLTLLRDNGFSDSHISKIIGHYPVVLVSEVEKNLKPKFEFFNSKGLSGADLTKVFSIETELFGSSLEKTIIPSFDFLKSIVGTDEKVIVTLKLGPGLIRRMKNVQSGIAVLRSYGVPLSNIAKLIVSGPRVFYRNHSWLSEKLEEIKKLKFDPTKCMFVMAIQALNAMSSTSLEAKFDIYIYKSWGWSEDQVICAFRKQPFCMTLSEENIMLTMDCFVNKFGYTPSSIAEQPDVLLYCCEKRIVPRCLAIQFLIKNGKVEQAPKLYSFLKIREDVFLQKYISRYEKEVPELLSVYQR